MATVNDISIPSPPRLSGNVTQDISTLQSYCFQLYSTVVIQGRVLERLNAISNLTAVSESISASPTQAEVVTLAQKINAIISGAS